LLLTKRVSATKCQQLQQQWLLTLSRPPAAGCQVLAAQENDGNKVVREVLLGPRTKPVGQQ
jgi:hypothetical protein